MKKQSLIEMINKKRAKEVKDIKKYIESYLKPKAKRGKK